MKTCTRCHAEKPVAEFYPTKRRGVVGRKSECKECSKALMRAWKAKQPKKRKPVVDRKKCTRCGLEKDLSEFGRRKLKTGLGYLSRCRQCLSEVHAEWRLAHLDQEREISRRWRQSEKGRAHTIKRRETSRAVHFKRRYGITVEDYDAMVEKQKGECLICQRRRRLVVDHCHTSLKVRGLLCGTCNTGLGAFSEDPKIIQRAIEYLLAA